MRRRAAGRLTPATARFGDRVATIRTPRLSDAAAWSTARRAAEERLRPAFDSDDAADEWAATQTELAFVERCLRLRGAMRAGLAVPGIILLADADGSNAVVFGEAGLDSVDERTGTGELSAWSSRTPGRAAITSWAIAVVVRHAFAMSRPLRRVVAPQPVTVPHAPPSLTVLNFDAEITLRNYRLHSGGWTDHRIWVGHNTSAVRQASEDGASR